MTWFRLLLGYWVYHWHWAYHETELNHFERMKLAPSCGNEVATIINWVKGKFLAHRSLLGIPAPMAALIAVLVWYFPLWQLSSNPSTQVDDEGPRGFYPTKEEMQAGAEVLRASGIVEQINGGQEWEPVHRVSGYTGQRGTLRLAVEAKWAVPVAHSGPWSWTACDEPRKVVTHQRYSNITLVLQRRFREGCGVMPAWRRGAWHGSVWPVRYCPAYPQATAATRLARTVPGAAFPAPPGRPAAS